MDIEDEEVADQWDGKKEKGTDKQMLHQAKLKCNRCRWSVTVS